MGTIVPSSPSVASSCVVRFSHCSPLARWRECHPWVTKYSPRAGRAPLFQVARIVRLENITTPIIPRVEVTGGICATLGDD